MNQIPNILAWISTAVLCAVILYAALPWLQRRPKSQRLEWSPTLGDGKRMSYAEAEQAVAALGDGWRMPSVEELLSIVDYTRCDPAIDIKRFPDTKSGAYWTSTPCAWAPRAAWFVSFYRGYSSLYNRGSTSAFVRAVRSLPAGQ